jgi:hypothetical protein
MQARQAASAWLSLGERLVTGNHLLTPKMIDGKVPAHFVGI